MDKTCHKNIWRRKTPDIYLIKYIRINLSINLKTP